MHLELANARNRMSNLPLQVGAVHAVVIDQRDTSDASTAQVQSRWRAQAACANYQHMSGEKFLLPVNAYFIKQDVAGIAKELFVVHSKKGNAQTLTLVGIMR